MKILFAALAAALILAGCGGDDAGRGDPNYEGVVESAGSSSIVIRDAEPDACGRSAFVPTDGVTVERDDDTIAWTDIREGERIRVWTNGDQDDSCPSHAGAQHVEVVG